MVAGGGYKRGAVRPARMCDFHHASPRVGVLRLLHDGQGKLLFFLASFAGHRPLARTAGHQDLSRMCGTHSFAYTKY